MHPGSRVKYAGSFSAPEVSRSVSRSGKRVDIVGKAGINLFFAGFPLSADELPMPTRSSKIIPIG